MNRRSLAAILSIMIAGGAIGTYWYWASISRKPFTLRYGYPPYADSAVLYVAVDMGFFEEESLNVSLTSFLSGSQIIEAAAAGSLDGGFAMIIPMLQAFEGGINLTLAGGGSCYDQEHDPCAIVVRTDSPIQAIEDLEGETIALRSVGPEATLHFEVVLEKHGLTLEDMDTVVIRSPVTKLEALIAGSVDATGLAEPLLTPALEAGEVRVISPLFTEVFPDHTFQMATSFFLKSFIDENKDVVDAFIRAYGKAVDWINDHPQGTRDIIVEWTGIDPEVAEKMILYAFSKQLDSEGIERLIDLMLDYGYLEQDIEVEDIMYQG